MLVVGGDGGTEFPILFPYRAVADNQGQDIGIGGTRVCLFLITVTVQTGEEFLNFNEFDVQVFLSSEIITSIHTHTHTHTHTINDIT